MSIRRRGAFGWVAALAGVLVLGCAGAMAQKDMFKEKLLQGVPAIPDCRETPNTCSALADAVRSGEQLRITYLQEVGACREGACTPRVKPFDAGTDAGVLGPMLDATLSVCEIRCNPQRLPETDAIRECRRKCYGTP